MTDPVPNNRKVPVTVPTVLSEEKPLTQELYAPFGLIRRDTLLSPQRNMTLARGVHRAIGQEDVDFGNPYVEALTDLLLQQGACHFFAVTPYSIMCERPNREKPDLMFRDIDMISQRRMRDGAYHVYIFTKDETTYIYPMGSYEVSVDFVDNVIALWHRASRSK